MRKRLAICFASLGLLSGCGGGDSTTGPPAPTVSLQLAMVGGDNQQAQVATALPQDLVVRVTDSSANPQSGKTVSWSVAGGDAVLSSASTSTNAQGLASTGLTLGTVAGAITVRASVSGATPVTFSAMAVPGPAEALCLEPSFGVLALSGSMTLTVNLTDAYGNAIGDAAAQLQSRSPSVLSISGTTASGQARGVARVIARAESLTDSATYAVVEPDGFALVFLTDEGEAVGSVTMGDPVSLNLKLIPPAGGNSVMASLQGAIRWNAAKLRYAGAGARGQGMVWLENESDAGELRYAGYSQQDISSEMRLATYQFEFVAGNRADLTIDVEVAGDEEARIVTNRITPVVTALEVLP